jgi:serine/threonine protein kinase
LNDPTEPKEPERLVNILALEYAPNGELYDYLAEHGAFPIPIARWAYKQILAGLQVIHKAGFAHKDLRPENILIAEDFTLKIADFDLSCRLPIRKYSGTPSCLPPEVNMRQDFDNVQVDMYSAGIIAFIIVTGFRPFKKAAYGDSKFFHIQVDDWAGFWEEHSLLVSDCFKDFVELTLAYDASKRMSMHDTLHHDWLNGPTATLLQGASFMQGGSCSSSHYHSDCSDKEPTSPSKQTKPEQLRSESSQGSFHAEAKKLTNTP